MDKRVNDAKNWQHVRIDSAGQILLPDRIRETLDLNEGDWCLLTEHDHGISIETLDQVLTRAQRYIASFVPEGVSLVDEILSDRRAEVEQESQEGGHSAISHPDEPPQGC